MAIRKSVFGSPIERESFRSLNTKWSHHGPIYHNLPFLNIIDTSDMSNEDFLQLKKASVDYTLCDQNDQPTLSIELDGMGCGFNVGRRYVTEIPIEPKRRYMMDLKLKVAEQSRYPFFVISPEDFTPLAPDLAWAIVDGVIGSVFARRTSAEFWGRFIGNVGRRIR
jgi:hypothetical protein